MQQKKIILYLYKCIYFTTFNDELKYNSQICYSKS